MSQTNLHWWTSPRVLFRSILLLDDSHHSVALGTAIGMFIGLTPTVGIQMLLVAITALCTQRLFRFNRFAALITVYVSNPLTLVPLYYFLYRVGTVFVAGRVKYKDFERILDFEGLDGWWEALRGLFVEIGTPLFVGGLIVATIGALATYPIMRYLLAWFHGRPPTAAEAATSEKDLKPRKT